LTDIYFVVRAGSYKSYVPKMVLKQISEFLNEKIDQGITDLSQFVDEPLGIAEFPAAVLFVDISGTLPSMFIMFIYL
jgi:hypothetical protein